MPAFNDYVTQADVDGHLLNLNEKRHHFALT